MASGLIPRPKAEESDVKLEMPDRDGTLSGDTKDELRQALKSIRTPGTFASSAAVTSLSPGLFVHGVGEIAMPLSEFQACQLIAKARQAPFGKGSDTIVDTTVRNTWELDPSQFKLRHTKWPAQVKGLCDHVAKSLGINGAIKAELYKMLVYEKGAMFKAHTDYRWVLTYNLALDPAQPRPSANLHGQIDTLPLRNSLNRWLAVKPQARQNKCLYHVLDHDYTEASVSLNALKAQDLVRVQALKEECSKLPADVYLALLEKMEVGSVEWCPDPYDRRSFYGRGYDDYDDKDDEDDESGYHDIDYVLESSHKVITLVDLDGNSVTKDLQLGEEDILQQDPFEGLIGKEEYEGYMGNWGPTATHWYHLAAVVIVPHDSLLPFFRNRTGDSNEPSPIGHLARRCMLPEAQNSLFAALEDILHEAWNPRGDLDFRPSYPLVIDSAALQGVVKLALQRGRYDLFDQIIGKSPKKLEHDLLDWMREWLGAGNANQRFKAIQKGITSAVFLCSYLSEQSGVITRLVPIPDQLSSTESVGLAKQHATA
ncbi:hypothetical protein ACHAPT_003217 [Fusarium lateritium]